MNHAYAIIEKVKSSGETEEQFNKLAILSAEALRRIRYFYRVRDYRSIPISPVPAQKLKYLVKL